MLKSRLVLELSVSTLYALGRLMHTENVSSNDNFCRNYSYFHDY